MTPPLNVLQIVPSVSLVYGGPSQMVLGFSQALAEEGANVTILTTDSNGDVDQPPLDVPLDRPVEQDGYYIRYFHCSPFRRYKFSWPLLSWLSAHAQEFDIAHIHALFSPVSSLSAAIARSRSLPYILRPLGTLDPADLRKKARLKQLYAALLERPNLEGAAAVHFTSDQEAQVSHRFGTTSRDLVLPLGVVPPESLPDPRQILLESGVSLPDLDTPLLLYMSRIDPKKGLDLLIPALEQLLTEQVKFHWILAGANPQDSSYETEIRQRIQASSLKDHTAITGFVSGRDKTALLQAADLFVLPSYYENFGIAVAEAMIAGTPVVISDQVHIHNAVSGSEAGWVCECTVASLVEQLRRALSDAAERHRRGASARRYATENYSWRAIAQRTLSVYREILDVR